MYREEWRECVSRKYKDESRKATYIIETKSGKKLVFSPIQFIYEDANPGDSIYKNKNSDRATLITKKKDTLSSSIYSSSCDEEVLRSRWE